MQSGLLGWTLVMLGVTSVCFLSDPTLIEIVSVHRCFPVILEEMTDINPKEAAVVYDCSWSYLLVNH